MAHTMGESGVARLADGRTLHYMSGGVGNPTVVFESGLGASRSEWGLVAPLVAQQFQAVVYDRANLGRSDPDGTPRTLERLASDLGELLSTLGVGPYILVGHSYGGTIALVAAAHNRSQVAGLVLVDHSDEHVTACCQSQLKQLRRIAVAGRWFIGALRRLHLQTLVLRWAAPGIPADVAHDLVTEDLTASAEQGADSEEQFFAEGLQSLRRQRPDLGAMPVTVISGTKTTLFDRSIRTAFLDAHRRTATRLHARHVFARKSGHLVVFTEPQLIADEIGHLARLIATSSAEGASPERWGQPQAQ